MTRINTNIPALRANHQLGRTVDDLNLRLQRLSTGLRINRGADDPAGLIVSERLRSEIQGLQQAVENSTRASSVISTAEGALNEVSALLLDLQRLVTNSANVGALLQTEIDANQLQINSILDSVDRIANTTSFAGSKLLDGSRDYLTTDVANGALQSVALFSARVPRGTTRSVKVTVTQSALTARVVLKGTNPTGPSTTSGTAVEIRGEGGTALLNFAAGTNLADIRTAINDVTAVTGVSAIVSAAGVGGVASALILNSTAIGADAFVSVSPISGNLIESANSNTVIHDTGRDATVLIGGQKASMRAERAEINAGGLDARLFLTRNFTQTLSSATFTITGGGSLFQLTPQINPNGQTHLGIGSVNVAHLGNAVMGFLHSLRTGGANDLDSRNFSQAQKIVNEAVDQIATQRARLGNVQRHQIEPGINNQQVALENITASESLIRDAEIATEISALTRAQILLQATQNSLQIANSLPAQVLSLLG